MDQLNQTRKTQPTPTEDEAPGEPNMLYRFFDANEQLLYVGITSEPGIRWKHHSRKKAGWRRVVRVTIEHFNTRDEAIEAEEAAIISEQPEWNIMHNRGRPTTRPRRRSAYRSAGKRATQEIKDGILSGDWPRLGDLMQLYDMSRQDLTEWVDRGVQLAGSRLLLRYRINASNIKSFHPDDVMRILAELRKLRSADDPDGACAPGGDETWLKLAEASALLAPLKVTDQTVQNWADTGRLRSKRLGTDGATGHRRIARSSVEEELARYLGSTAPSAT